MHEAFAGWKSTWARARATTRISSLVRKSATSRLLSQFWSAWYHAVYAQGNDHDKALALSIPILQSLGFGSGGGGGGGAGDEEGRRQTRSSSASPAGFRATPSPRDVRVLQAGAASTSPHTTASHGSACGSGGRRSQGYSHSPESQSLRVGGSRRAEFGSGGGLGSLPVAACHAPPLYPQQEDQDSSSSSDSDTLPQMAGPEGGGAEARESSRSLMLEFRRERIFARLQSALDARKELLKPHVAPGLLLQSQPPQPAGALAAQSPQPVPGLSAQTHRDPSPGSSLASPRAGCPAPGRSPRMPSRPSQAIVPPPRGLSTLSQTPPPTTPRKELDFQSSALSAAGPEEQDTVPSPPWQVGPPREQADKVHSPGARVGGGRVGEGSVDADTRERRNKLAKLRSLLGVVETANALTQRGSKKHGASDVRAGRGRQ